MHAGQCADDSAIDTVPAQRNVAEEQKQCGGDEIDIA